MLVNGWSGEECNKFPLYMFWILFYASNSFLGSYAKSVHWIFPPNNRNAKSVYNLCSAPYGG
jgi:hypothetical protein